MRLSDLFPPLEDKALRWDIAHGIAMVTVLVGVVLVVAGLGR